MSGLMNMEPYPNKSGDSPITFYEISTHDIKVHFKENPEPYTYSYKKAGKKHVDKMKALARNGSGLATYISRNVRHLND